MTTTKSAPEQAKRRRLPWALEIYRSYVGRKWVMAITGIILLGYIAAHLVGNLKVYFGPAEINEYGEALRELGGHLAPRTHVLWVLRIGLIAAFVLHIHAAYSLAVTSNFTRGPEKYSRRDYAAADYASRTMRWTGTSVLLFVLWHLADLTWGIEPFAGSGWERGEIYANLIASFERIPVAALYIVANIARAAHIYHGTWSLFQSMGWSNPRFNAWRQYAAAGFAALVLVGNLSFPIAVLTGLVS